MLDQLTADGRQTHQAHVENQGLTLFRQRIPIQIQGAVFQVTGNKTHRLRVITMGQRYACVARTT